MGSTVISISACIVLLAGAGYALHQDRSRTGLFLSAALTTTALLELFDLLSLSGGADAFVWKKFAVAAESFLPLFWILCSRTFSRLSAPWKGNLPSIWAVAAMCLFPVAAVVMPVRNLLYAPDFPAEKLLFLGNGGLVFYIALTVCLVVALVNFEVTLVNATVDSLRKIKLELIGLGTILTVQIFYYSQALLYRTLNMNYLPLRSFLYLVATVMIAYSLAFRRGKVHIQISRQIALRSVVLSAVAAYLVLLGLLGEGMHHFGAFFSRTLTLSLAFLAGIGLLVLLLSERIRREIKVGLHKNFYQQKHDYRTQWLSFTEQLSSSRTGEELLQRILAAYCDIFGFTGSALYLLDESREGYCLLAEHEIVMKHDIISSGNSLVQAMARRAWVINVSEELPDVNADDTRIFIDSLVSFLVPIFEGENLEGFIILSQPIDASEVYIFEDYDLMKTISRQASLAIMHHRMTDQLSHARESEAIGNVATFVAHDLKNLVSNLSLIVENAARHIHNPDFQHDMLASLGNTVEKMQRLIGRLRNLGEQNHLRHQTTDLLELANKTASLVAGGRVSVSGTAEVVYIDENEIQKVILNLVMNGIEASGPDDVVSLETGCAGVPFIKVTDHGCGMTQRFMRTELFKPFRTTKEQGLGIGLYQCRQIIEAHGGRIEANSDEGSGSVFTVWFDGSMLPYGESARSTGSVTLDVNR